ncbi:MAG: HAD-IA family hydrolase [Ancalomicrobiaceae bacterium]|nr:HAD-IA family hydrolase [Ancalomicrobiaceae bacterium]
MIDTVVFDVGNVLVAWDPRIPFARLFDDEKKIDWFLAEVCSYDWNLQQDLGRDWAEAEAEAIARYPDYAEEIRFYRRNWGEMVPGDLAVNVRIKERLEKAGVPVYAITNFALDTFDEARARFPYLYSFRDTVISAVERVAKPEARIFHILLERNNLRAEQCVFIDDSAANAAGARAVGMAAIHYTPDVDLALELRGLGFPV